MSKKSKQCAIGAKWPLVLLLQFACSLAVYALLSLGIIPGGFVYDACLWFLAPLAGFVSACIATHKGLLNYVAWIIPPAAQFGANFLVWGYGLSAGPIFLCGFISLVGAATGEVLKRQSR